MGRTHEALTDELRAFLERQPMFFVCKLPVSHDTQ